jgi:putative acetyltransferase
LLIRAETKDDLAAIHEINRQAFGQEDEALLVEALRNSSSFIPALSLVAFLEGAAVGHIMFTGLEIETPAGRVPALALAPLAVLPEFKKRGIGTALTERGIGDSRELEHRIVIVVGHPEYYPRFGFEPARALGLECPFPVPDEAFMVLGLVPGALEGVSGMVIWPPEFQPGEFAPPKSK